MGDFVQQNSPKRRGLLQFFSSVSLLPVWEEQFWPQNCNQGLCFHGYIYEITLPLFTLSAKKGNFFTDQDMSKAIAQNCAKRKGPTKKIYKINFEVHGPRIVFHLSTLIEVLRKHPQFGGKFCQNLCFLEFLDKRKIANFKSNNLCDENLKIKNLR